MTKSKPGRFLRHRWQYIVFFSEFIYMGLELNASRIMSPIFGTTLDIWSCIIGTILASSAIGNWLAGRIGDHADARRTWIPRSLFICALWLACIPALYASLIATGIYTGLPHTLAALVACIVLFMLPGICIGMLSPLVLAEYAAEQKLKIGLASSGFYTAMTLGGLAGTFATGFYLVPALGSTKLVILMSVSMGILAIISALILKRLKTKETTLSILTLIIIIASVIYVSVAPRQTTGVDLWRDTKYGRAHVIDHDDDRPTRSLLVSGGHESAMYLDDDTKAELAFDYLKTSAKLIDKHLVEDDRALCLGGGAYSFPKYLAYQKKAQVDVVEIDDGVTDLAHEYFYVDEVSSKSKHKIKTYAGDGRVVLPTLKNKYSLIFNDTFAGESPVATLSTLEATRAAKSALTNNGLYVMNVIGIFSDAENEFLGWELKTLRQTFASVKIFSCYDEKDFSPDTNQNWVIVATDDTNWQAPKSLHEVQPDLTHAKILTDDDCPVEYLSARLHLRSK